jgi:hypothetical protein
VSGFSKISCVAALLAASLAPPSLLRAQATQPAATAPASQPGENAIAKINGREINNAAFYDLLIQVAGVRVFQEVIDLSIAQQIATTRGVPLEGPEFQKNVQAEYQLTLDAMNVPPGTSNEDKQKILDEVLHRQGITTVEFGIGLQQNALLRAISHNEVSVTDKDLEDAYLAKYGDRVQAKIIDVGTLDRAALFRDAVEKQRKSIEAAAQELGLPAPNSWTISSNATSIDDIKKVAFAKNEGDLSAPVTFNGRLYMVYVEKKIPSQLGSVSKDSVKEKLRQEVQQLKETQWMKSTLAKARSAAKIDIHNPQLFQQFKAIQEAIKRQAGNATPAAPVPAVPATAP